MDISTAFFITGCFGLFCQQINMYKYKGCFLNGKRGAAGWVVLLGVYMVYKVYIVSIKRLPTACAPPKSPEGEPPAINMNQSVGTPLSACQSCTADR
jgi:hypothetical protein